MGISTMSVEAATFMLPAEKHDLPSRLRQHSKSETFELLLCP